MKGVPDTQLQEKNGRIHKMQCVYKNCKQKLWNTSETIVPNLEIDPQTLAVKGPVPACKLCGRLAIPNSNKIFSILIM